MGVIDALSAGFRTVAGRLWLILPPVLLDLFLWLGPRLSVRVLIERWLDMWQTMATTTASDAVLPSLNLLREMLNGGDQAFNLLLLLSNRLLGQPSLASLLSGGGWGGVVEIRSFLIGAMGFAVCTVAGLFIAAIYLSLIVSQLSEEGTDWQGFGRRLARRWLHLVLYLFALAVVTIAISLPFSFMIALATLMGSAVGTTLVSVLSIILIWLSIWMFLSLFFVANAVVADDANVAAAIWRSVNVVARNFWSTVGLWLLTELIVVGFAMIWQRLSMWPAGAVVGIVGNAYLGTGLVAASVLFYRDRYQKWQTQRVEQVKRA